MLDCSDHGAQIANILGVDVPLRLFQSFLIGRLFFLPGFWGILLLLLSVGGIVKACDTGPHDYVCFGDTEYDYDKPADRNKLSEDMVQAGASSDILQMPPCNEFGSRWYPPEKQAAMLAITEEMMTHPDHFKMGKDGQYYRVK